MVKCNQSSSRIPSNCDRSVPLTLTLSRREREQPANLDPRTHAAEAVAALRPAARRRTILPLPQGEGRDEGEGGVG